MCPPIGWPWRGDAVRRPAPAAEAAAAHVPATVRGPSSASSCCSCTRRFPVASRPPFSFPPSGPWRLLRAGASPLRPVSEPPPLRPRRAEPAAFQSPPPAPTPGMRPSHFSAILMWASTQPSTSPISSSEWWWMTRVRGDHLPPGPCRGRGRSRSRAGCRAIRRSGARDDPGESAITKPSMASTSPVWPSAGDRPRRSKEGRDLAAAQLLVAVGERGPGDRHPPTRRCCERRSRPRSRRSRPPGRERLADLLAEVGVHDLGVLVDEDERLEPVELRGPLEEQVVVAEDRPGGAVHEDRESGSAARRIPGSANRS